MIFNHILKWNILKIQRAISEHLEKLKWNVETSFGFADSGQTAFIVTARKEKYVIIITLENDEKKIRMQAGMDGKYLPEGKQIPKYSKVFTHTKINQASKYFEKILEDLV